MKQYNILILTDHRGHGPSNSIYELGTALKRHPRVRRLHVASRGLAANDGFFYQHNTTELEVWPVSDRMDFDPSHRRFLHDTIHVDARYYDLVLLRLPRPIPDGFFPFLKDRMEETRIINRPSGIVATSPKSFLLELPEFCPPMALCHTLEDIWRAQEDYPIVIKPLENYGGQGIVKLHQGMVYKAKSRTTFERYRPVMEKQLAEGGYLAMKYLRNVRKGDKRIVVVNGEVLGAALRLPAKGSWLCNAAQGGNSVLADIEPREAEMVRALSDLLLPKGIVMFGMDTLVGDDGQRVLSEVNTLSVGGLKPLQDLTKKPILQRAAHLIMAYAQQQTTIRKSVFL
jgi:glutathione synthase